jgi:hypothetical protein
LRRDGRRALSGGFWAGIGAAGIDECVIHRRLRGWIGSFLFFPFFPLFRVAGKIDFLGKNVSDWAGEMAVFPAKMAIGRLVEKVDIFVFVHGLAGNERARKGHADKMDNRRAGSAAVH